MRILKPGEPCPCCGEPLKEGLSRKKILLEVMELPRLGGVEVIQAAQIPPVSNQAATITDQAALITDQTEPGEEAPPTEGEEKRAILKRLKDYREAHGPGSLEAVSVKTARQKSRRLSTETLRYICADGAPKMPMADWRKISRALDQLKEKEQNVPEQEQGGR